MSPVPSIRIDADAREILPARDYVLYWMTTARRSRYNPSLARAIEHCRALERPLLVFEPLRIGYPHASDRFHTFIIEGMADQSRSFESAGVTYYPYVERTPDEDKGLLAALAKRACVVVTDAYPCFFLPHMQESARKALDVRFERVDGNGLLPMAAADRLHGTAYSLRRFLQKTLPDHLEELAEPDPLDALPDLPAATIPSEILERWPAVTAAELADPASWVPALDVDHSVGVVDLRGGERRAQEHLDQFLEARFHRYAEARNHPEDPVTSGLSPWLHFGHLSSVQIFDHIVEREEWDPAELSPVTNGARAGWWGMSEAAEGFLDQLITWRELGFNLCTLDPQYDQYDALPEWARRTLEEHKEDPRDPCYTIDQLENAQTDDPLWNAAQEQLRRDGIIHNYLRMLWGKKVLHWARSPREAFQILLHLNNKYALDGRDPNSYCAISWIFGRFDRAWGPERPIFGKVRYMSSENTARKVRVRGYIRSYAP